MGRVQGKVAFVTGAGRGQGRSHAVRLAEEGADIIAVDVCHDIDTVGYPMSTPDDLKETARLVEAQDRRIVAAQADVRERAQLQAALERGVAELGKVDIVVAQAGILAQKGEPPLQAWTDVVDTNLIGVLNAVHAALPQSDERRLDHRDRFDGRLHADAADAEGGRRPRRHRVHGGQADAVQLHARPGARTRAAPDPGQRRSPHHVNTDMLLNEAMYKSFRPDLEHPTREDATQAYYVQQAMPVPWIEPVDISNAVLFLASDEARYVTGMQLRVDAGGYLKWYDFHA